MNNGSANSTSDNSMNDISNKDTNSTTNPNSLSNLPLVMTDSQGNEREINSQDDLWDFISSQQE